MNRLQEEREWSETLAYLYIRNYYEKKSGKDSIKYFEWDNNISNNICSFNQSFKPNINYYIWECKGEGGIKEIIEFPKIENSEIKSLINLLFYEKQNNWISEFNYKPNGAGCYYEIKQQKDKTILKIYCGC